MPVSPARAAAFDILMRVETTDAYASEMLHASRFAKLSRADLSRADLSWADHGLLTELVMGVLRWRGVLDAKIAERYAPLPAPGTASRKIPALSPKERETRTGHPADVSTRSIARLDAEVLTALRMGAYQILFLDRVPKHAAVNESVELVKSGRKQSAAGLVNAVLRKVERGPEDLDARAAHPEWLVERWVRVYGVEAVGGICEYDQIAPRQAIRFGTASNSEADEGESGVELGSTGRTRASAPTRVVEELREQGVELEPGRLLSSAFRVKSGDITATKAFRERRVFIQDEGSQLVALLVGEGENILDCCAAPGGKTRILAERNPETQVIAVELHPQRAALVSKLVTAENVRVIAGDVRKVALGGSFDRVLVDAPCTGTGTLARNPEIKWRLKPEDLLRLQKYQVEILRAAMKHVSPGGRIVYSTCSLEPEENEQVIEKALAGDSSFSVVNCCERVEQLHAEVAWRGESLLSGPYLRTVPGVHPCDGFFAAVMGRVDS